MQLHTNGCVTSSNKIQTKTKNQISKYLKHANCSILRRYQRICFDTLCCNHRHRQLNNMLAALAHKIAVGITVIEVAITIVFRRIWSYIPFLKERLKKREEYYFKVPYQDFLHEYGSYSMFSKVLKTSICDLNKTVRLGSSAPDCKLVTTDGKECRLLDFVKGNRPLVLNFGSCT